LTQVQNAYLLSTNRSIAMWRWLWRMASTGMWRCVALVILQSVLQLLVAAYVIPSSLILSTMMIEVICSSRMLVLTKATWHHPRRWHSSVAFPLKLICSFRRLRI
jgi:hypothetical protein